jgi:hypothetical protein
MTQRLLDPVNIRLSPQMRKRLDELADERAESIAVLIREALDLAYSPQPRAPEPYPHGANLRPPPGSRGFMS